MVANFIAMAAIAWQLVAGGQNKGPRRHWHQYQSAIAMIVVFPILKLDSFQLLYAKITCVRVTNSAPTPDVEKSRIDCAISWSWGKKWTWKHPDLIFLFHELRARNLVGPSHLSSQLAIHYNSKPKKIG